MEGLDQFIPAFDLPPEEAIEYLESKGVSVTFAYGGLTGSAHNRAFTVAGVASADLLQDIKSELQDALEQGTSFAEFKKRLRWQLGNRGWDSERYEAEENEDGTTAYKKVADVPPWRWELIYRQNLQSALNAGRLLNQRAVAETRPYLQLLAISDDRTSDVCKTYNELVAAADDPIWSQIYPPNHFRCRSRVRSLSQAAVDRMKLKVQGGDELAKLDPPPEGFDVDPLQSVNVDDKKYDANIRRQLKDYMNTVKARL